MPHGEDFAIHGDSVRALAFLLAGDLGGEHPLDGDTILSGILTMQGLGGDGTTRGLEDLVGVGMIPGLAGLVGTISGALLIIEGHLPEVSMVATTEIDIIGEKG